MQSSTSHLNVTDISRNNEVCEVGNFITISGVAVRDLVNFQTKPGVVFPQFTWKMEISKHINTVQKKRFCLYVRQSLSLTF